MMPRRLLSALFEPSRADKGLPQNSFVNQPLHEVLVVDDPEPPSLSADNIVPKQDVRAALHHAQALISTVSSTLPQPLFLPPAPAELSGREPELADLVLALTAAAPARALICISGPSGTGKSALIAHALLDPAVVSAYGDARYFVRLDGVAGYAGLVEAVAAAVRVPSGDGGVDGLLGRVAQRMAGLGAGRAWVMVLDGLELGPGEDERGRVEAVLQRLADGPGGTVVVTTARGCLPAGSTWTTRIELGPLSPDASAELWYALSGRRGSQWDDLRAALGHVPLALRLVAHVARDEDDASALLQRWARIHADLEPPNADGPHSGETPVRASIAFALENPRVASEPSAQRLLGVLALFPAGIPEKELVRALRACEPPVASLVRLLRSVGLVEVASASMGEPHTGPVEPHSEIAIVRLLPPIRQFMRTYSPDPLPTFLRPLIRHYLSIAKSSHQVWHNASLVPRLAPHIPNIEHMLLVAAGSKTYPRAEVFRALGSYVQFVLFSETGSFGVVRTCVDGAFPLAGSPDGVRGRRRLPKEGEKEDDRSGIPEYLRYCLEGYARLLFEHGETQDALDCYTVGRRLYADLGSSLGQAECQLGLATLHLESGNLELAETCFRQALPVLQTHRGSPTHQARCVSGLARVLAKHGRAGAVGEMVGQARRLFGIGHDEIGEADLLLSLGIGELGSVDASERGHYLHEAVGKYASRAFKKGLFNALIALARHYVREGEFVEAAGRGMEALKVAVGMGDPERERLAIGVIEEVGKSGVRSR